MCAGIEEILVCRGLIFWQDSSLRLKQPVCAGIVEILVCRGLIYCQNSSRRLKQPVCAGIVEKLEVLSMGKILVLDSKQPCLGNLGLMKNRCCSRAVPLIPQIYDCTEEFCIFNNFIGNLLELDVSINNFFLYFFVVYTNILQLISQTSWIHVLKGLTLAQFFGWKRHVFMGIIYRNMLQVCSAIFPPAIF